MYIESRGALPSNFHGEVALIIVKVLYLFPKKIRDMSRNKRAEFILASVHEYAFLFGVGVQIDEHEHRSLLKNSLLGEKDLWTTYLIVIMPHSVEIVA